MADKLDYTTFFFFLTTFISTEILTFLLEVPGTSELEVPGTWELEVPGTWELRSLKFRELGNSLSGVPDIGMKIDQVLTLLLISFQHG